MSQPHRQTPPHELLASLRVIEPFAWRSLGFSLVAGLLVLAPTFYMFEVYDRVVNSRNVLTLALLTALVLGVYVVMEVLEWAGSEGMREAGRAWDQDLAPRVFDAVFAARLRRAGPPSLQPLHDLRVLRDFMVNPLVPALMGAPVALVLAAILFAIAPLIGWAAVLGAAVQALLTWMAERGSAPGIQAANRAAQSAQQHADACWRNAEAVQAMGMLGPLHRRWAVSQRTMLAQQAQASHAAGGFHAASKWVQQAVASGLLGLGAWLLLEDRLPGGAAMLIVGSVLGGRLLAPLVLAVSQWRTVVQVRAAWDRLSALLQQTPAPTAGMALPAPRGPLVVEGIAASAPGSSVPILRGVGLALLPGEALAVVGPSGSGKSTLARVIIGLWPTLQGKVRLDGADVHQWSKSELGVHLGYLPQEVELLDGSIADNISRFGLADDASVEQAARLVGLHDWILGLPQGYDTAVGPEGTALSGGQRQRVGLARALVGNPALVVLDEPNSSLDEAGDQALLDAIAHLKASGSIVVAITHRSNLLPLADKLLLLREGTVQAFGPRDDVLAQLKAGVRPAAARSAAIPPSGPMARPQPAA